MDWYAYNGTSSTGSAIDIDFVLLHLDEYYDKLTEDKEFVDSLGDEYENIVVAYDNLYEEATIIYNHLKEETPSPNSTLSYSDNIDLFRQYNEYFSDAVLALNEE